MPAITFRFWILSLFFGIIGSVITQFYYYRVAVGYFSIYFVNLASYALGTGMARLLPKGQVTIGTYSMSFNPGPFNIKEHCLIGIAVSTASSSAYAIDILSATDLFLNHRINAFGSIVLIITTQCLGYGMAGTLRKYLVYPAEMVWWGNLVQVVFYNAIHSTDEFKTKRMIRGWSYMKYFWVFCGGSFVWEVCNFYLIFTPTSMHVYIRMCVRANIFFSLPLLGDSSFLSFCHPCSTSLVGSVGSSLST